MTMLWKRGRTIWTDRQGDLICDEWWDGDNEAEHVLVAQSPANNVCTPVFLPTDHDDKVAVAAAFVDALGLECDGFRAKARPFQVGDVVRHRHLGGACMEVRAVDGDDLWLRQSIGVNFTVAAADCTLITPAEEVERGEVEQSEGEWRTPSAEEVVEASRVGANVLQVRHVETDDEWAGGCSGVHYGQPGWEYRVPAGWSA